MIRKLFRIGLKLGLLAAVAALISKIIESRQAPAVVPAPSSSGNRPSWPPVEREPAAPTPTPSASPTPAAKTEPTPAPAPRAPGVPATAVRPLQAVRKQRPESRTKRWVEPQGDVCPTTHPVKAKMSSKIFHVVGGAIYARTNPDRCYATPEDAESDGLRASKR